jgi:hypothetical protein
LIAIHRESSFACLRETKEGIFFSHYCFFACYGRIADLADRWRFRSYTSGAELSLAPGDVAKVTLRIVAPTKLAAINFLTKSVTPVVVAQAVNTQDAQNGIKQPSMTLTIITTSPSLPASDHFIHHYPEGINVDGGGDLSAFHLFRRHIGRSPKDLPSACYRCVNAVIACGATRQAEIGNDSPDLCFFAIRWHEDYVSALEIAVDDSHPVSRVQRLSHLTH